MTAPPPFTGLQMFGSSRELEIGKAAEHLVCADLILSGYRAFLSDQGLPYDVVVDLNGRLIRIQVKSTLVAKNVSSASRAPRQAYNFNIRRRGANSSKRLSNLDCDIVALVALDVRIVAYLPIEIVGQSLQIVGLGELPEPRTWRGGWMRAIGQWPFVDALEGSASYNKTERKLPAQTHCKYGHEFAVLGTVGSARKCAECNRIRAREHKRKLREAKQ